MTIYGIIINFYELVIVAICAEISRIRCMRKSVIKIAYFFNMQLYLLRDTNYNDNHHIYQAILQNGNIILQGTNIVVDDLKCPLCDEIYMFGNNVAQTVTCYHLSHKKCFDIVCLITNRCIECDNVI